jgi:hypothetical protein
MTEKIAAPAFVFVFALLFSIAVLGLLTAYRDRSSGLSGDVGPRKGNGQ